VTDRLREEYGHQAPMLGSPDLVERFNRTIQEELAPEIQKYKNNIPWLNRSINDYLMYYNNERLHAGIGHKTPAEVLEMFPRS